MHVHMHDTVTYRPGTSNMCNRGQACRSVHNVAAKIIIILTEWWIHTISNILSSEFIH